MARDRCFEERIWVDDERKAAYVARRAVDPSGRLTPTEDERRHKAEETVPAAAVVQGARRMQKSVKRVSLGKHEVDDGLAA